VHPVPGPPQPGLGPSAELLAVGALAYDAIAASYDAQVQGDNWMREVLHRHYARVFRAGQHVLDIGCGTGIDAVFLARRGVRVTGIDHSPEMIAELRNKVAASGVSDLIDVQVLAIQDLPRLRQQRFDGMISAFASLSTLPDLRQFAECAAQLVKPGGRLVLHLLNRFSLWEWLGYLSHADWSAARQVGRLRTREFTIGGHAVRHTLYFPREAYERFFKDRFAMRSVYGLGSLRPPHTVQRIPTRIVRLLERLDVRTGHWPLVHNAGRFFVLDLERLPT
jgi:2-polyprenyl-3-methyl-5-hydroxy-6-metoxy-1,4-benzoquinol methylase